MKPKVRKEFDNVWDNWHSQTFEDMILTKVTNKAEECHIKE